jgi:hypothetical protein
LVKTMGKENGYTDETHTYLSSPTSFRRQFAGLGDT